jgi:acyl-CoA thioester hydrolase
MQQVEPKRAYPAGTAARDWRLRPGDVSFRGVIFPWDCDAMGHLSNKHYLGLFDQAAWHVFLALGYRPEMAEREHIGLADVHQTIAFHRELRAGQLIAVRSWLERIGSKSLTARHEMFDATDGTAVASLTSVTTFFHLRERKSLPIPQTIRELAAAWLSSQQPQSSGTA